jgi:hypothetical protein
MQYRVFARQTSLALLVLIASASAPSPVRPTGADRIIVFKDPNCGCCKSWIEHLRNHGFDVIARDTNDVSSVKRRAHVPSQLHSCHTAFVKGYVVEGHVPAADIARVIREKPKIVGVAVPGMPAGSPGMEVGDRMERYDVVTFGRDGSTRTYARH